MKSKPGIKTTEFWATLVAAIVGVMTMMGVFTPAEASQMTSGLGQIIGGVFAIVPIVGYIWSRGKVKAANGGE